MSADLQSKTDAASLAVLDDVFGPPPVLSTESLDAYNAIMTRCLESVKPKDFIEKLLTRDVVDASWEIFRYMRHKSLGIERKFRARIDFQKGSAKENAEKRAAKLKLDNLVKKEKEELSPTEKHMMDLDLAADSSIEDTREILLRKPDEFDHGRALEEGIEFHEKLDRLCNAATARRDNALEQLERYRRGLGQRLRRATDEVIDVEFTDASKGAEQQPLLDSTEVASR